MGNVCAASEGCAVTNPCSSTEDQEEALNKDINELKEKILAIAQKLPEKGDCSAEAVEKAIKSDNLDEKQNVKTALQKQLAKVEEYDKRTTTVQATEVTQDSAPTVDPEAQRKKEAQKEKEDEEKAIEAHKLGLKVMLERFTTMEWEVPADLNAQIESALKSGALDALTTAEKAMIELNTQKTKDFKDNLTDDQLAEMSDIRAPNTAKKFAFDYQAGGEHASKFHKESTTRPQVQPAQPYGGAMSYVGQMVKENRHGPIREGERILAADTDNYMAMHYQTNMTSWPEDQQQYTLYKRTPKTELMPRLGNGPFSWVECKCDTLKPAAQVPLNEDGFTNQGQILGHYQGYYLSEAKRPGRGQGCADVPLLDLVDDPDPNDVAQGRVGDCWLLSAISAVAEFDGAIRTLFSKTPKASTSRDLPLSDTSNMYTVTLYDLPTMTPKQIQVDERLCYTAQGDGLLGAQPAMSGELWVCYLEKAVAAHCGGWDNIDGGQCTHAWALLTGSREQYMIKSDDNGQSFKAFGNWNPNGAGSWLKQENNPHANGGMYEMKWPDSTGGEERCTKVSKDELFDKMCKWDQTNYIMAAGTKAGSDTNTTDGIVDGHAYTIISVVKNAGQQYGPDFDMVRMRNPWGKGEFKSRLWADDGRGWEYYPEVKRDLNPRQKDDGIFWMTKAEFFNYFKTIYLCAKDMSEFKEDEYAVAQ
jgi:hypothetical protein